MRLIDADELRESIEHAVCKFCNNHDFTDCATCSIDDVIEIVENYPTIDAVKVVRCEECEYSEYMDLPDCEAVRNYHNPVVCKRHNKTHNRCLILKNGDGFCDYGTPKEANT